MSAHTVLAVDDNEDTLDLVDETLSDEGFNVIRARSGPDALSLLMSQSVDLVLLDIMMPDMNGFAVLEMIRFIPRLTRTAVIVHTAHTEVHHVRRARDLGAFTVLPKPITPDKLLEEVRNCLVGC